MFIIFSKIEKVRLLKRMDEIIDIVFFLTKEGICKDMQREIISYFKYCDSIDVLKIWGNYAGNYEDIHIESIFHKNREDYIPILRRVLDILQDMFRLKGGCSIGVNEFIVDGKSHPIEKYAKLLQKQGVLHFDRTPLNHLFIFEYYHNIQVHFDTENVRHL